MSRPIGFGLALVAVTGAGLGPIIPAHADPAASPAKRAYTSALFQHSLSVGDGTTLHGAGNQSQI